MRTIFNFSIVISDFIKRAMRIIGLRDIMLINNVKNKTKQKISNKF